METRRDLSKITVWSPSHIAELLKQILYLVMLFLQGVEMSVASTRRSL